MYSQNDYRSYSELAHYGIQGMKWGVRNYQNKDGSLTPAGRERYGSWDGHKKTNKYAKYVNKDGTLNDAGMKKRDRIEKVNAIADLAGMAVGGAAGLAAGLAANVGFSYVTGVIMPFMQLQLIGVSTAGGAAALSNVIDKYGDKRLAEFDRQTSNL